MFLPLKIIVLNLLLVVCVLLGVAFITLLERKVLGYVQYRKGPNKVGPAGLLQPITDAVKLFTKENNIMENVNLVLYFFFPVLSLVLMMGFWLNYAFMDGAWLTLNMVLIMAISSFSSYVIMGSGWVSNSTYPILGSYRGVAQVISYEVSFSFMIIFFVLFSGSFSLDSLLSFFHSGPASVMVFSGLLLIWLISILAELNRAPFDFAESESELVSGFNTEYGSGGFALLFMAEYGNIMFMSYLTSFLFFNSSFVCSFMIIFFVIWVRGTYVRHRYDKLMMLAWKVVLPGVMLFLMLGWELCLIMSV